jgi:hypothetical protein
VQSPWQRIFRALGFSSIPLKMLRVGHFRPAQHEVSILGSRLQCTIITFPAMGGKVHSKRAAFWESFEKCRIRVEKKSINLGSAVAFQNRVSMV